MRNDKHKPSRNESITFLLKSLDTLIEELNIHSVQRDSSFNPMDIFSSSFFLEESPKDEVKDEDEEESEVVIQKTQDFLQKLKDVKFPGDVLQYSLISEKMFDKKYSIEVAENISEKILSITESNFQGFLDSDEKLKIRFYKLIDHIRLASFQISEITQHSIEKQEELMQELLQSRIESKKQKVEFEENINDTKLEIEKEITKIYVQFVTILGIFSAIVLSVFGGLQLITSSFQNLHKLPAWKAVLMSSIIAIAVLCMLFLLTRWISTVINKAFSFESERTLMKLVTNNGAFSMGIFVFGYLIIAAVVFSSKDITNTLKKFLYGWQGFPILLLLLFPPIAGAMLFIKTLDIKK